MDAENVGWLLISKKFGKLPTRCGQVKCLSGLLQPGTRTHKVCLSFPSF